MANKVYGTGDVIEVAEFDDRINQLEEDFINTPQGQRVIQAVVIAAGTLERVVEAAESEQARWEEEPDDEDEESDDEEDE